MGKKPPKKRFAGSNFGRSEGGQREMTKELDIFLGPREGKEVVKGTN